MESGIYSIGNKVNGKIYIGSSFNLEKRRSQHFSNLRHARHGNIHLQRAWNLYGENAFEFEVVEFCDVDECKKCEQEWLDFFNTKRPDSLYNISLDACRPARGRTLSQETRKKMSDAAKSRPASRPAGFKHSEETKRKIRIAQIGRPGTMRGKKLTEAAKSKISAALTGRKRGPAWNKGQKRSAQDQEKIIARLRDPEVRRRLSEAQRENWVKRKAKKEQD